ncbi:hypothetical protein E2P81_ATG06684 [Venturia nashicola]|nr:hypothetical protein E2P81_ATG06684 [Venturia nashicola]
MSEEAILEEVHNWLGLSLDFLVQQDQNQESESSRYTSQSPKNAEKCLVEPGNVCVNSPQPVVAIITPPASTDWESPTAEVILGDDLDDDMGGGLFFFVRFWKNKAEADSVEAIEILREQSPLLQPQDQEILNSDSISSYAVDSPIAFLEVSYGLVLGPFLEDLLRIYFQNIHPHYPVIDEFDLDVNFTQTIDDEILRQSRAMYLTPTSNTRPNPPPSFQHSLYTTFTTLYDPHTPTHSQVNLTQACLLLSYYSPSPSSPSPTHSISTWLSKAFTHAKAAGLDQMTSEVMTDRSRLIWCSLIVRERVVSFLAGGMGHPMDTSISPSASTSTCTSTCTSQKRKAKRNEYKVTREDFGLELCLPRFSSPSERGEMVEAFLARARLSEVLADILEFEMGRGLRIGRREVLKVSMFDVRLREWKRGWDKAFMGEGRGRDGRGSFYLTRVIAEYVFSPFFFSIPSLFPSKV